MTYADFLAVIQHVMGAPLEAAAYRLTDAPMAHMRGLFRFCKPLGCIEFQALYHAQSELSRFRVRLLRHDPPEAHDLAYLIWHVYNAPGVLPADSYWWTYKYPQDLAPQVLEAGRLLFAYGVPWLEGHDISPRPLA